MAIARDHTSAGIATTAASLAWSHTITSGMSGSGLVVGVSTGALGGILLSSVKWDVVGVNTTMSNTVNAVSASVSPTANVKAFLYWLASPITDGTAKQITVTPTSSCELNAGAESISGWAGTFNASSPQSASVAANTNPSVTVTAAANEWVIDAYSTDNTSQVALTAAQNLIFSTSVGSANANGGSQDALSGGPSQVMAWTGVTGTGGAGSVGVALKPTLSVKTFFKQIIRPFPYTPGSAHVRDKGAL